MSEARQAVAAGASALGLVSQMPSGPGVISEERIAEIVACVPPPIATFLLTARTQADAIVHQHAVCRTSTIQLVDSVATAELTKLRRLLPHVKLVQVVHVVHPRSLDEALVAAQHVDALLLDSGNPNLPIKELGGTGRVHDWQLSRQIRQASPVPVFLAGGLNSGNVADAIRTVQPFGIDLCSGVRSAGQLSRDLLEEFMRAVRSTA